MGDKIRGGRVEGRDEGAEINAWPEMSTQDKESKGQEWGGLGSEEREGAYSAMKQLLAGTCSPSRGRSRRPGRPAALLLRLPFRLPFSDTAHVIAVNKGKKELIDGAMSWTVDRVGRSIQGLRGDSWRFDM